MSTTDDASEPDVPHAATWSQTRRLQFIDFRLRWDGQINRADLTAFFGMSVPQASLDLAKYLDAAPSNLAYDRSSKTYVAAPGFSPLYSCSSAERYLNDLAAVTMGVTDPQTSFVGWKPDVELAPRPFRSVDEATLIRVVQAMKARRRITVRYQSIREAEPLERQLSPHAFGHDGFRWHVRAYCHLRKRFQDFVVGRIADIRLDAVAGFPSEEDSQWHRKLELVLVPNEQLALGAQRTIEMDYGMVNGETRFKCRHALLFYALRSLRLDVAGREPAQAQQVVLKNRAELEPFINEVVPREASA